MRSFWGFSSSHLCTTDAPELRAIVHMCTSTYELHMPQCPRRDPNGSPQRPKMPYIGSKWDQSGVNVDPHCAKQFQIGQTLSKLAHRLQDGCPLAAFSHPERYLVANFWPFLAIFTLFGVFSFCTVGAFLAIFPIFFGFVGIFWGNFGHF